MFLIFVNGLREQTGKKTQEESTKREVGQEPSGMISLVLFCDGLGRVCAEADFRLVGVAGDNSRSSFVMPRGASPNFTNSSTAFECLS